MQTLHHEGTGHIDETVPRRSPQNDEKAPSRGPSLCPDPVFYGLIVDNGDIVRVTRYRRE